MGNDEILESLIKSVYRFMAKMKVNARELKPEFKKFLMKIKHREKNRFETRSFAYLDIISWAESKVFEKPMSEIIHNKYVKNRHKKHRSQILAA